MELKGRGKEKEKGEKKREVRGGEREDRVREMEKWIEKKEREERRKNILVRRTKREEKDLEKKVEMIKRLGIKKDIKEKRFIGGRNREEKKMVIIKLKSVGKKIEVMKKRREVIEHEVRIEDDLTWKERKMKWSMEGITRREREKGKRVWIKYGKMAVEGKWWRWDEEKKEFDRWRRKNMEGTRGSTGNGTRE